MIVDVGKDAKMRRRRTVILIFIYLFIRTCTLDPSALVSHCCTCDRIVLQFCSDPSKCRVIVTVLPGKRIPPRVAIDKEQIKPVSRILYTTPLIGGAELFLLFSSNSSVVTNCGKSLFSVGTVLAPKTAKLANLRR